MTLILTLAGLPEDAGLELTLPQDSTGLTVAQLLERVFPADAEAQLLVEESFDRADNPDLPEIYEHFLPVMEQYRRGLCRLGMRNAAGEDVAEEDTVGRHLLAGDTQVQDGGCRVWLVLYPEYNALEYAAEWGFLAGEVDLILWLRICTAMYFLDKHEVALPQLDSQEGGQSLRATVEELERLELVRFVSDGSAGEITPEGRVFIGNLLAETEGYIDRYDHFKDVVWDEDTQSAWFDSGHGVDLRVEAFIAEGLDPVRAVFLLRLYDGTMDEFVGEWPGLLGDVGFFNGALEPVVNRSVVNADLLERILDQGLALVEDAAEAEVERRREARVARRVMASVEFSPPS